MSGTVGLFFSARADLARAATPGDTKRASPFTLDIEEIKNA